MAEQSSVHLKILDPMRGVAAFAVVVFHYLGSILPTLRPNGVEHIVEYGKWGVQVFFVISGFVIPYAMQNAGYNWRGSGRFLLRRAVRIAPPAYFAALAMIAFHLLAIAIKGRAVDGATFPGFGWRAILGNLTFSVDYLGTNWYNFVYWSLTAEFEFYVVIAAILPWIRTGSPHWRVALIIGALLLLPFIPGAERFGYAVYFVIGMLVFLWRETGTDRNLLLLIAGFSIWVSAHIGGAAPTTAAALAALVILSGSTARSSMAVFLGDISYSLYITHVPVAFFAESLLKRMTDIHTAPIGKAFLLLVYLTISLVIAWLFHRFVEQPFVRMSKQIARHRRNHARA